MRELFQRYNNNKIYSPEVFNAAEESASSGQRRSFVSDDSFVNISNNKLTFQSRRMKRCVKDLKLLSESALPSRAISLIRKAISSLDYDLQANERITGEDRSSERIKSAIKVIKAVLDSPSTRHLDFQSFISPVVEDILVWDAGCWEYVSKPAYIEGNTILAMCPVAGYTMAENVKWTGDPSLARWSQVTGSNLGKFFLDVDIEYLMERNRTWTPYGLSRLEVVVDVMNYWLGLSTYQGNVTRESYPNFLINLGQANEDNLKTFKSYWQTELQGRGAPGFVANLGEKMDIMSLKPKGDGDLYLEYQEALIRIVAFAFDLKPTDFNLERDVNRSTADMMQSASLREAVYPIAHQIAARINQRVIPRIAKESGNEDIKLITFAWDNLIIKDSKAQADIDAIYLDRDVLMIDEARMNIGKEALPEGRGQYTTSQYKSLAMLDPMMNITEETILENQQKQDNELNPNE